MTDATPTIRTVDELRAWAVRATAARRDGGAGSPLRYLLVTGANGLGQRGVFLSCRTQRARDSQVLASAVAKPLLARWPTARTGGRSHLSPLSVLELVAGARAVGAARAEATWLERQWAEERARLRRLDELLDWAFASGDVGAAFAAKDRWRHERRPELGDRSADAAVAESQAALDVVAPMLERLAREREAREARGWSVEPDPDDARRIGRHAHVTHLRAHETVRGDVHEHGALAAVATLVGRPHWHPERSEIAWVSDDPAAAARLVAAAAVFEAAARGADDRRRRPMTVAETTAYFLWELAARALRDAPGAAGSQTRGSG